MSLEGSSAHHLLSSYDATSFDDDPPTLSAPISNNQSQYEQATNKKNIEITHGTDAHLNAEDGLGELSSDKPTEPFIIIQINRKDGFRDDILMRPNDDPDEAADHFIKKNQFSIDVKPKIVKLIEAQFERNGIKPRRKQQEHLSASTAEGIVCVINQDSKEHNPNMQLLPLNPRFVMKSRDEAGNKVFINICDHPFVDRDSCISIGTETSIVNEFGGKLLVFDVVCSVADVDRAVLAMTDQLNNDISARQVQ